MELCTCLSRVFEVSSHPLSVQISYTCRTYKQGIFLSFVAQEKHLHRRRNQIIFSLLRLWYCKDKRQVLHRANYVVTANGNVYSRPIFYLFRCNLKASNVSYWLRSGDYNQVTITQKPIKISVLLYQRYEMFCL